MKFKTNWTKDDYFEIEDFQRILDVTIYIKNLLKIYHPNKEQLIESPYGERVDFKDLTLPETINQYTVKNIEQLKMILPTDIEIKKLRLLVGNETFYLWNELNILESNLKAFYISIDSRDKGIKTLSFELGGDVFGWI